MTNKTNEQLDAEADEFIENVLATLPESMQTHHIIRLMGIALTSYCDSASDAGRVLLELSLLVKGYYQQEANGGVCMCDGCIAQRKAEAH